MNNLFNGFALLISGGGLAGIIVLSALPVIALVIVLIVVLGKKKSGNPEYEAAEMLLAQHNRMHSRHKELIDDYHKHKPLSDNDKKLIEERNAKRGADGAAHNNPLNAGEPAQAENIEKHENNDEKTH